MFENLIYKTAAVKGVFKYAGYKLIYGKNISWKGLPRLSSTAKIRMRHGARIILQKGAHFAEGTLLRVTENAIFEMGEQSGFNSYCVITCRESIVIGNNVMFGPFVTIHDHDHIYDVKGNINEQGYKTAKIVIEDNVWIGANVTILKGVHIGRNSVIAAGTVINKNVPSNTLIYDKNNICHIKI